MPGGAPIPRLPRHARPARVGLTWAVGAVQVPWEDARGFGGRMKALTIKQPWVHAILRLEKDIENRPWQRSYRGWIALHAAGEPDRGATFPRGHKVPDLETLDYSAICGVARVVDIVEKSRSKWFLRPKDGATNYGWVLAGVKRLKRPIPYNGTLGLWEVPPSVVAEIQLQLPKLKLDT